MKVYSFFTESHRILKEDWFEPTLPPDCESIVKEFPEPLPHQESVYGSASFNALMRDKVTLILKAIEDNAGELFCYADIDVQFFGPLTDVVAPLMSNKDILFQQDSPQGLLCAGVFFARSCDCVRRFWERALERCCQDHSCDDQDVINRLVFDYKKLPLQSRAAYRLLDLIRLGSIGRLLTTTCRDVRWGYLPRTFFSGGTFTGRQWDSAKPLPVPADAVLHHANWTTGVENKVKQLSLVRRQVLARRHWGL